MFRSVRAWLQVHGTPSTGNIGGGPYCLLEVLDIITDDEVHSFTFRIIYKQMWVHTQTADHKLTWQGTFDLSLAVRSSPFCSSYSAVQQESMLGLSGSQPGERIWSAGRLVKYLNYFIDVSKVINLAAAHPPGWPVPAQLPGALWRSCQTGSEELWCTCWSLLFWQVRRLCSSCKLWGDIMRKNAYLRL